MNTETISKPIVVGKAPNGVSIVKIFTNGAWVYFTAEEMYNIVDSSYCTPETLRFIADDIEHTNGQTQVKRSNDPLIRARIDAGCNQ